MKNDEFFGASLMITELFADRRILDTPDQKEKFEFWNKLCDHMACQYAELLSEEMKKGK